MANLGLLGAIGGLGKAVSDFGSDLVKRREEALDWARKEAQYQRERVDKQSDTQDLFAHEDQLTATREAGATARNEADIAARAAEGEANRAAHKEDQAFTAHENQLDRQSQANLATLRASLERANDAASARLKAQLESGDVAGVKYGEKYSQPMRGGKPYGRPVSDPNSPYSELLLVKKDGTIVHSGKLILAPQNRSGQDGEDGSPY